MLFFERTKKLVGEFLLFKKYKQMHPAIAVFVGIFLIPFALFFFIFAGFTFLSAIMFALFESPIKYLHNIIHEEVKDSKTAIQVIVYYFSWPLLFIFYVFYAFFTLLVFFYYLGTMMVGYIASLGGYKFHVSPMDEDISKNLEPNPNWKKNVLGAAFFGTAFVLVLVGIILYFTAGYMIGLALLSLYMLFCCVYVPIAFRDSKEEHDSPEAKEE